MPPKIGQYIEELPHSVCPNGFLDTGQSTDFSQSKPAALTVIKLDGDCKTVIPGRLKDAGPVEIETAIFDLHQENVKTAIEYRARILQALLDALKQIR